MDKRLGYVKVPFEEIVFKTSKVQFSELYYQQYIELGSYYTQVKRYLDIFGKNQVKIFLTEDIIDDIPKVLNSINIFLNIPTGNSPNIKKKYNVYSNPKNKILQILYSSNLLRSMISSILSKNQKDNIRNLLFSDKDKPHLNNKTKEYLLEIYKPDIIKLEKLISRDLSFWYQ